MKLFKTEDIELGCISYKLVQWVTRERGVRVIFHVPKCRPREEHADMIRTQRRFVRETIAEGE